MRDSASAMPKIAIVFGLILEVLGVGAFLATGAAHLTALIPSLFGTVILVCGILALVRPGLRKHVMHVAALFGLGGAMGGLGMGLPKLGMLMDGTAPRPLAVAMQIVMGVVSLVFLVLCVKSFIDARRAKPEIY